jgi:hypothetical protein
LASLHERLDLLQAQGLPLPHADHQHPLHQPLMLILC